MANAYYLKFGDVKGECPHDKHKEEIDILSWSWGASNPTTIVGSGMSAGKVSIADITITKRVDKASLALLEHCISGKHVKEATLACAKSTGGKSPTEDHFSLKYEEVYVSSYQIGGSTGEDTATETVTLSFRKHTGDYKEQKADGTLTPSKHHAFDHLSLKLE